MAISTNPKPTIYRNLYENTGLVSEVKALQLNIPATSISLDRASTRPKNAYYHSNLE